MVWKMRAPLLGMRGAPQKAPGEGDPRVPALTSRPHGSAPGWLRSGCRCPICCRSPRCGSGPRCPARSPASCARCPPPPSLLRPAPAGASLQGHSGDALTPNSPARGPPPSPPRAAPAQHGGTYPGCRALWWLLVASQLWQGSGEVTGLSQARRCPHGGPRGVAGVPPGTGAQRGPQPRPRAGWC